MLENENILPIRKKLWRGFGKKRNTTPTPFNAMRNKGNYCDYRASNCDSTVRDKKEGSIFPGVTSGFAFHLLRYCYSVDDYKKKAIVCQEERTT